jgi:hypothetical protein
MPFPLLYEINTRCWLRNLSEVAGGPVTLADIPDSEFRRWQGLGFTHIWLMGVWTGGSNSRAKALQNEDLRRAYSEVLPGWTEADVGPSPYAVAAYSIDAALGGEKGMLEFRRKLKSFGLKLFLDFVPNHMGLDHPWLQQRPDLFVQAAILTPATFVQKTSGGQVILAHGKDPFFPAWTDTVQLDYRRAATRDAMKGVLLEIGELCDGVRCDMAMLVLNDVFARTWNDFPSEDTAIAAEFWAEAISSTHRRYPEFEFLGEVYWGVEARLQALGFNYTYDKVLYDLLTSRQTASVQGHLLGMGVQGLHASAHFLENHDERRIASLLNLPEHRAAALVILGLPGLRFLYEGQLSGWQKRLPVQLLRRAPELDNADVYSMYEQLLRALRASAVGQGTPEMLAPVKAWPENPTDRNFILVQWTSAAGNVDLIAVNLAPHRSQCFAPVKLAASLDGSCFVTDLVGTERFVRTTGDLRARGLYLDLDAHGAQLLHFEHRSLGTAS